MGLDRRKLSRTGCAFEGDIGALNPPSLLLGLDEASGFVLLHTPQTESAEHRLAMLKLSPSEPSLVS